MFQSVDISRRGKQCLDMLIKEFRKLKRETDFQVKDSLIAQTSLKTHLRHSARRHGGTRESNCVHPSSNSSCHRLPKNLSLHGLIAATVLIICLWPSVLAVVDSHLDYRPIIHYSPPKGFMNDPNGLVIVNHEFHLFHQLDPYAPVIGHVHWGHAVSRDLVRWETLPVAINETAAGQAFSGSAVHKDNKIYAIYTRASTTKQAQELAISDDNGRTFVEYAGNPVLDRNSSSFRDPQVFWHEPTKEWKMTVVLAREHKVLWYGSSDLINWQERGSFGPAGIIGVDYECPIMSEIPLEEPTADGKTTKWVLFVSINPGMPLGGSGTQYFIGEFDGNKFIPDSYVTKIFDYGKDNYALQTYSNARFPLGIAWLSNWQYANDTPTGVDGWRGVMTIPRNFKLRNTDFNGYLLTQQPVGLDALHREPVSGDAERSVEGDKPLEISAKVILKPNSRVTFSLISEVWERVDWGYDANVAQAWVDRGKTYGFSHRFYTDKTSAAVVPGTTEIDIYAIWDRSTLETFFDRGTFCITNLVYFKVFPNKLRVTVTGEGTVSNLTVNVLTP